MPQVLVPGVAQAALKGTIGPNAFACIFHYGLNTTGVNWSTAQLNSLCDGIMSGINLANGVGSLTSTAVNFNNVLAVDLGTTTPALGASSHAPITGTAVGTFPPSTCVLIDSQISSRYRGGHPRTYMPPMGANQMSSTDNQWTAAAVGAYQTAFTNMQDTALNAVLGTHPCVPRYTYTITNVPSKNKYLRTRSGLNGVPPTILQWLVKAQVGTQRRRIRMGG